MLASSSSKHGRWYLVGREGIGLPKIFHEFDLLFAFGFVVLQSKAGTCKKIIDGS